MIVNYDHTVITIVNYDSKTFIIQVTGLLDWMAQFPRMVKANRLGQFCLSSEDVAMHGGHEVLMEGNSVLWPVL